MTQRALRRSLNDWSISHRIRERNSELDDRRAHARQLNDQLFGCIKIGIAGGDERDEAFPAGAF